ncbi:hypothetical protein M406DRAFT_227507, partial [Cryphonectria parasitica EP155]
QSYNDGVYGTFPTNEYHSAKNFSPAIQVNTWNKQAMSKSGSHILIRHDAFSDSKNSLDASPLILSTEDLSAVYLNRSFPGVANVNVQMYEGKPILSFFGGPIQEDVGFGNGFVFGYDQSYREVGLLAAEDLKVGADFHEFVMTGDKTAIITAYEMIDWDLSPYLSDDDDEDAQEGKLLDCVFQEINLDTFEVLFQWRASEHIPMDLSYEPADESEYGWDFFHVTSVQKSQTGDYLVSAASMHSIYMIDGTTGAVKWTLGGKGNDFEELPYPAGRSFSNPLLTMGWQHHAQFYPGRNEKEFTVFDNHGVDINGWGCTENCSRGLHFSLDPDAKRVQLLNEYLHPVGLWSISQGSVQVLDNGNVFIGWGRNPAITEHLPGGDCVFDIQFSPWRSPKTDWKSLDNYRAYKVDWTGRPHWKPDIMGERGRSGGIRIWTSWNGATEVKEWVLLGSKKSFDINGAQKFVTRAQRDGFETSMWVEMSQQARYFRAVALDARGHILSASDIFDIKTRTVTPA